MSENELKSLIKLLKDEDRKISNAAMSAILKYNFSSKDVNQVLAEFQESEDPALRKKIHQIQAIQRARRRRRRLISRFSDRRTDLVQGLADLNIIWYNEYNIHSISRKWNAFILNALKYAPKTPSRISSFMQELNFKCEVTQTHDADAYCLAAVLDEHTGADIILASIALELGRTFGLFSSIVRTEDFGFGVIYSNRIGKKPFKHKFFGEILLPGDNWRVCSPEQVHSFTPWTNNKVLKYVASVFFVDSIIFDEPRYIQIFGSVLSGKNIIEDLDKVLPYPYGDAFGIN
jgi:hypothetical protein